MNQSTTPGADAINRLIQELNKLPGIGPKSAQRLAFYLMRAPQEQSIQLAEAILSIKQKIKLCSTCFNVTDPTPVSSAVTTSVTAVRFVW